MKNELINGRTPEEIKAAVINCDEHCSCVDCPEDERGYCDQSVVIKYTRRLIERLESERDAALAKVPRWISVKDKLPPRERWVLTVNGYGHIRFMAFWKKEKERWAWIEEKHFTHRNDITHWMPPPEPPKEETT